MHPRKSFYQHPATLIAIWVVATISLLVTSPAQASSPQAPPQQIVITADIPAAQDIGVTEDVPTATVSANPYFVISSRPTEHFDHNFIYFDLTALPANATIDSAELVLEFNRVANTIDVQTGYVEDAWLESTMNWNNQPPVDWSGPVHTVDVAGEVRWPILSLVEQWMDGSRPNYGIALRGQTVGTGLVQAQTKDGDPAPRLILTYAQNDEEPFYPRPDLGDAPDSTNHHGVANTAYPVAGIQGQFPTVYNVPANQPAGPLHRNETGEGILGQYISRETEADDAADQDGLNNIIRDATGAILDIADNDRGDDGWRNRNIKFFNCRERTLTVRVYKAPNATLKKMYLNVWFDGNRDGDWADIAPCPDAGGGPADASYEWIVQDHIIDMTAIAAGDYLDLKIDTDLVHNSTPNLPHWMRFTLSEERAVQPPNGDYPDGRGPHPTSQQKAFKHGETEDILQRPPTGGEDGELILEKRVITDGEPVAYAASVTYQIRLQHDGGTQPIEARIRDELPYPLHVNRQIDDDGNVYLIDVSSPTSSASPLTAELNYLFGSNGSVTQEINWEGTLEPDAEIILSFEVHIHPICGANENTTTITNLAQAQIRDESPTSKEVSFEAACPGYTPSSIEIGESIINPIDPSDWTQFSWNAEIQNSHQNDIALGFVQQNIPDPLNESGDGNPDGASAASLAMIGKSHFLGRVELKAGGKKATSLPMIMDEALDRELGVSDDAPLGKLLFCILPGENDICPDPAEYPEMWGEVELPQVLRRADLGDAPDSSNHDGVGMAAYPGIPAAFPTVFDPATGLPPGPRHLRPWLLHLGPDVSSEMEADRGPDADGVHNIIPPANTPDLDWFDDGSDLTLQGQCEPALADVEINVSAQAQQHFSATKSMAYLNIWLDWNYDGDWDDLNTCTGPGGQSTNVVEHILIDFPVDVAKMPLGTTTITDIVTSRVPWPAQFNEIERWVRFTLSDAPSNKTLSYFDPNLDKQIEYGDGRGHQTPFRTGETEDYLWDLRDDAPTGPDFTIQVGGVLDTSLGGPLPGPTNEVRLRVTYANVGSADATDGVLTIRKSDALANVDVMAVAGNGIDPNMVTNGVKNILVPLPKVVSGAHGSVALRLGPVAAEVSAAAVMSDLEVTALITATGELDESNNSATALIEQPNAPLRLAGVVPGDDLWRKADTTCQSSINLVGNGEPMQPAVLRVNGTETLTGTFDANGLVNSTLTSGLAEGKNLLWIDYADDPTQAGSVSGHQAVRLNVNPSLAVDPITLLLTDSQGRQVHPSTLDWSHGSLDSYLMRLREGESYNISINSCASATDLEAELLLNDKRLTVLRDDDEDGRFTGSFTYRSAPADDGGVAATSVSGSSQLRLVIKANGVEQSIVGQVDTVASATVVDAATDQPIADATVTALVDGKVATLSDANPQQTAADGSYSFTVADGIYQLGVTADGYQTYRSQPVDVSGGSLAEDVQLMPVINEPADHTVYMTAQGFSPDTVKAKPGDIVEWVNLDLVPHSVTGDAWDSGELAPFSSFKVKFTEEGDYSYSSNVTSRAGSVTVQQSTDDPTGESPGEGENPSGEEEPLDSGSELLYLPLIQ